MTIKVSCYSPFRSLLIDSGSARISSGLLNDQEARDLALKLLDSASDLLDGDDRSKIVDVLNDLSNRL